MEEILNELNVYCICSDVTKSYKNTNTTKKHTMRDMFAFLCMDRMQTININTLLSEYLYLNYFM